MTPLVPVLPAHGGVFAGLPFHCDCSRTLPGGDTPSEWGQWTHHRFAHWNDMNASTIGLGTLIVWRSILRAFARDYAHRRSHVEWKKAGVHGWSESKERHCHPSGGESPARSLRMPPSLFPCTTP